MELNFSNSLKRGKRKLKLAFRGSIVAVYNVLAVFGGYNVDMFIEVSVK